MKEEAKRGKAIERELTDAEWEVMGIIWDRGSCTAGDVREALAERRGWAYSTVKTTMDRMVRKGILRLQRIRNLQVFSARISRSEVAGTEVRRLLHRAFDGAVAPMVNHLVANEKLTPEDLEALRQLIERTAADNP